MRQSAARGSGGPVTQLSRKRGRRVEGLVAHAESGGVCPTAVGTPGVDQRVIVELGGRPRRERQVGLGLEKFARTAPRSHPTAHEDKCVGSCHFSTDQTFLGYADCKETDRHFRTPDRNCPEGSLIVCSLTMQCSPEWILNVPPNPRSALRGPATFTHRSGRHPSAAGPLGGRQGSVQESGRTRGSFLSAPGGAGQTHSPLFAPFFMAEIMNPSGTQSSLLASLRTSKWC